MTDLLHGLVEKFCDGSYALAAHYVNCGTCHVVGVAVDHECDVGEKLADKAYNRRPNPNTTISANPTRTDVHRLVCAGCRRDVSECAGGAGCRHT